MSEQKPIQPYIMMITQTVDGSDILKTHHPQVSENVIYIGRNATDEVVIDTLALFVKSAIRKGIVNETPLYLYLVNTRLQPAPFDDEEEDVPAQYIEKGTRTHRFLVVSETPLIIGDDFINDPQIPLKIDLTEESLFIKPELLNNLVCLTNIKVEVSFYCDIEKMPAYVTELDQSKYLQYQLDYFIKQIERNRHPCSDDVRQCQDIGDNPDLNQDLWIKPGIIYKFNGGNPHATSVVHASLMKERKPFLWVQGYRQNEENYIFIDDKGLTLQRIIPDINEFINTSQRQWKKVNPNEPILPYHNVNRVTITGLDGGWLCEGLQLRLPTNYLEEAHIQAAVNQFYSVFTPQEEKA